MKFNLLFSILSLFFTLLSFCQNANRSIRYVDIDDGLSNSNVTSIYQDRHGLMWFGTYDGLNYYDGNSIVTLRHNPNNKSSLADNHVYYVSGDKDDNIWVGTTKGLSVYNKLQASFTSMRYKSETGTEVPLDIGTLEIVSMGRFMMVATNIGLIQFEGSRSVGRIIPILKSHSQYTITSMAYDVSKDRLWCVVNGKDICLWNKIQNQLDVVFSVATNITCIEVKDDNNLWIAKEGGLYSFNVNTHQLSRNYSPKRILITDIARDKSDFLWVTTDGQGLWQLIRQDSLLQPFDNGLGMLRSNVAYSIYVDNVDRKWVGTFRGGINLISNQKRAFENVVYNPGEPSSTIENFILSLGEDSYRNIWIGTDGAGLRRWDRKNNSLVKFVEGDAASNLTSNFITNILRDHLDNIWVSTYFGGILRYQFDKGTFKRYTCFNSITQRAENNIWVLYQDNERRLWASATNTGSLYLYNPNHDRFELYDKSLVNIQAIGQGALGDLWVGDYFHLIKIDKTRRKHQRFRIAYPIRCIVERDTNHLWVGTEGGGLLLFNKITGSFQRFTTREGLPNNSVLRIVKDRIGYLWLSTFNGLSRLDPRKKSFKNFSSSDGLQSNQFGFNAGLMLSSGELLFGGVKGFDIVNPNNIHSDTITHKPILTGLLVDTFPQHRTIDFITNSSKAEIRVIEIPYDHANIQINYTAVDFSNSARLRFSTFLKGLDRRWALPNVNRHVAFSHLPVGNFHFQVRVVNSDGISGPVTSLLIIKVLPPWYRTWWAYLSYLVIVVTLVYWYHRYNQRRQELNLQLQMAAIERKKEREVNESKLSFFTNISHEFRTPLTLIINPVTELLEDDGLFPAHKQLSLVQRNAKRLLSLVDQLLLFRKVESKNWELNLEYVNLNSILQEAYLSFEPLAASKHLKFSFQPAEGFAFVKGDKEKLEIILFNLLSNAIKYTEKGSVSINITKSINYFVVKVEDSGCGLKPSEQDRIFDAFHRVGGGKSNSTSGFGIGLYVSQKLAVAHDGEITCTTNANGTTFSLFLPQSEPPAEVLDEAKLGQVTSPIFSELIEGEVSLAKFENTVDRNESKIIDQLINGHPNMVVIDDDEELRFYLAEIFSSKFNVFHADDGSTGVALIRKIKPDIIISDVLMKNVNGLELCSIVKSDPELAHIPIVLLTGSASDEAKVRGFNNGADDYIAKPFGKELILARIQNIMDFKGRMQEYFLNSVLSRPTQKFDWEHKSFFEQCVAIVDANLDNPEFGVPSFCKQIGMSHPSLYKKIKAISGLTINVFIRYLRLRKAAQLLITTSDSITLIAYQTGFNDVKYFRQQFAKVFGMNPSEFVKQYRKPLGNRPGHK